MSGTDGLSYAILGTGALGGLYGGLLARSGRAVHFLLKSDYAHVSQNGLRVDTPLGDFHLPSVQCYASPHAMSQRMPAVDVAIVAWKTTANDALAETLQQVCGPQTIVLVLQNGLDIESAAAGCVGAERVLGGCCFLCCCKVGPGHIQHVDYGRISFGEYARELSGEITPRMQAIAADFQQAGIDMQPAEDLRNVRWRKLVWNIPYNGLSVVLGADTRQLMQDSASAALVEDLMREVCEAASRCGYSIDEAHVAKMLEDTRRMVPYDSSMRLDFLARRPMEVEAIFGNPLRAALQTGYRPSKIEMLYQQLCFLDRRLG
ncbi:MAG: putative 2-dehydropantoate 2-reductase [Aureliella sp.]